ncbi:MAG TPA: M20/M25/M40 family metallo-hydrolase, partial [Bacillota bacterium]|nr:M20/M25/M40 family metallo-hydrolase [Bacillota bacterium]
MEMDFKRELEKNLDSMISDLKGLLQIPSIAGEAEGEYPFGKEVQKALEYMLNLGKSMGFEVKNVDNYGGHIDFPGSGEGVMALVGHIDVVPEGEGWTWEPFDGTVKDGWIYGRGVQDDKGPTMVALYVMKILKDL